MRNMPIIDKMDGLIEEFKNAVQNDYGFYQALSFPEFRGNRADRTCDDRWSYMESYFQKGIHNYLDLGSNMGFFIYRAGQLGITSIGIDNSWSNVSLSKLLASKYMKQNIGFLFGEINIQTIRSLPKFDIISILSVFHHLVFSFGFHEADKIMCEIVNKTNRYLFFETGQYNEKTNYDWSVLSFMGNDCIGWIHAYLSKLGFQKITLLGEIPTHLSGVNRGFFVAEK